MDTSANDYGHRLAQCWKIQDCGSCVRSSFKCGWCPSSSACVPASSLLSPLKESVCPLRGERYELRTGTLGCNCSTATLLSIIVTVFCTIAGLLLLWVIAKALLWIMRIWGPGAWGGWEMVFEEDGKVREGVWIKRHWKLFGWQRREKVIDETERRPLL